MPKKVQLPNEKLKDTVNVSFEATKKVPYDINAVVPKDVELEKVYVMAGKGTSTPIRDLKRLYKQYNYPADSWQKKSGTVKGDNFSYVIHWYESDGKIPLDEYKIKGVGKI